MARELNKRFINRLTTGDFNQLLSTVKADNELALQIRDNYINIYYRGGNILKVKPTSFWFDEYYFFTKDLSFYSNYSSKTALQKSNNFQGEEDRRYLSQQRDELIAMVSDDPENYFAKAKEIMNKWFSDNPKDEREEQHLQIKENSASDDYCIIDIEYAISTNYTYFCNLTTPKGGFRVPRFDIVAINQAGEICVIELKKGLEALKGDSGLAGHLKSYQTSIGRDPKAFINHIRTLNDQMKILGFQSRDILNTDNVRFMFAYKFKDNDIEEKNSFYAESTKQGVAGVECIFIDMGSNKLLGTKKETL
ncbi:MAG: hypothetical protein SNJ29_15535 [Rikenellaceae bacterium]